MTTAHRCLRCNAEVLTLPVAVGRPLFCGMCVDHYGPECDDLRSEIVSAFEEHDREECCGAAVGHHPGCAEAVRWAIRDALDETHNARVARWLAYMEERTA